MAPVKKYKGKRIPTVREKTFCSAPVDCDSTFDRVINAGARRSPVHIFSSSSEMEEKPTADNSEVFTPCKLRYFPAVAREVRAKKTFSKGIKKKKTPPKRSLQQEAVNTIVEACKKKLSKPNKKNGEESGFPAPLGSSTPLHFKEKLGRFDSTFCQAGSSSVISVGTNSTHRLLTTSNLLSKFANLRVNSPKFRPQMRISSVKIRSTKLFGSCSNMQENECTPAETLLVKNESERFVFLPGKKYRRSLAIARKLGGSHRWAMVQDSFKGRNQTELIEEALSLQKCISGVDDASKGMLSSSRNLTGNCLLDETATTSVEKSLEPPTSQQSTSQESCTSLQSPPSCSLENSLQEKTDSLKLCTFEDLVLKICDQNEPLRFSDILPDECFNGGCKLGEGVFGEVFSLNRGDRTTVVKIIPIEGDFLVNGEKQKTFEEVFSELLIAQQLHNLRFSESQYTNGFVEVINVALIQDCYPERMIELWKAFDEKKGSDNDCPTIFKRDQLLIAMELGNAGEALETYLFTSARHALSVFKQVAFSLAVAETAMEFEHRDLHWGNVLVDRTAEKDIKFVLQETEYIVKSYGFKATIIDYTLSRITFGNQHIFNDIGRDPEMFLGCGDYQFDVYRLMKEDLDNEWYRFEPRTNARWLHYLIDKMIKNLEYGSKTSRIHKLGMKSLKNIEGWIESCHGAHDVAKKLASGKS